MHLSELGQHSPAPLPPGGSAFPSHPHLLDQQLPPQQHSPAYAYHHQLLVTQQRPVSPPSPFAFAPPPIGDGRGGAGESSSSSGAHLQSHHLELLPGPDDAGVADGYRDDRSPDENDDGAGFHPQAGYHASLVPPHDSDRSPSAADDVDDRSGRRRRRRAGSDASSGSSSNDGEGSPSSSRSGQSTGDGDGDGGGPSRTSGEGAGSRSTASGSKPASGRRQRPPRTSTTQARPQVKVAPGPKENLTSIAAIRSYPTGEDDDRPFQCDLCPQNFVRPGPVRLWMTQLSLRRETLRSNDQPRPIADPPSCLVQNRNHDLKRHRKIHMELKPFSCLKCNKHFSRKDALRRHWLVKGCKGGEVAGAGIRASFRLASSSPFGSGVLTNYFLLLRTSV